MQINNTQHLAPTSAVRWINCIILLIALEKCTSDTTQITSKKLIGRWQIAEFKMPGMPPEDTAMIRIIQQAGAGKEKFGYMNFKPGGQMEIIRMGQSEQLQYWVSGDTLIIYAKSNEPNEPMLVSFDGNNATKMTDMKGRQVYVLKRK